MKLKCKVVYGLLKNVDDYYPLQKIASETSSLMIEVQKASMKGSSIQILRGNKPYVRISEVMISEDQDLILVLDVDLEELERKASLDKKLELLEKESVTLPFYIYECIDGKKMKRSKVFENEMRGGLTILNQTRKENEGWSTENRVNVTKK